VYCITTEVTLVGCNPADDQCCDYCVRTVAEKSTDTVALTVHRLREFHITSLSLPTGKLLVFTAVLKVRPLKDI